MKAIIIFLSIMATGVAMAQDTLTVRIPKLEIERNKKEVFSGRDSSMVVYIDTLVMKNKSQLVFFGKKDVQLHVRHAYIEKRGYIYGTDSKNNGTDFQIDMRFDKLGSLYVLAGGQDANNNGSRTYPNGNGGDVVFTYDGEGIVPQTDDKKSTHYLHIDARAGGYRVNPQSELRNIYSLMNQGTAGRPLGSLSQGMVYSGSPGEDGDITLKAKE
ncbi:hypothetical protein [Parapedobacter sp. 10938]|uniref:hypothetical protein n=1 Tax=Parapedobacter flavus TaxID=3110225 RepID=UPI002DB8D41F|nr:hypothetical protein [Parapedobacter sp. 10938]MEC3879707.1 hypothetical protein [Parapedobacter sp. 10938]